MWTRPELKVKAKRILAKYYWMAFLVTLIAAILTGSISGAGMSGSGFKFDGNNWQNYHGPAWIGDGFPHRIDGVGDPVVGAIIAGVLIVLAIISAVIVVVGGIKTVYQIFVGGPIDVGMKRYFLEARQERSDFTNLFYSFRSGRYLNAVKAMAWRLLFSLLWGLLFVIPGIVKNRYSYGMVPYLVADNPTMDYQRALKLSMAMTNGEKWNMFVLDLSFLLWVLACFVTCGLGFLFLSPYYEATRAELYAVLRRKAIDQGLCTAEELGQLVPEPVA